jgi:hypothetical protein
MPSQAHDRIPYRFQLLVPTFNPHRHQPFCIKLLEPPIDWLLRPDQIDSAMRVRLALIYHPS